MLALVSAGGRTTRSKGWNIFGLAKCLYKLCGLRPYVSPSHRLKHSVFFLPLVVWLAIASPNEFRLWLPACVGVSALRLLAVCRKGEKTLVCVPTPTATRPVNEMPRETKVRSLRSRQEKKSSICIVTILWRVNCFLSRIENVNILFRLFGVVFYPKNDLNTFFTENNRRSDGVVPFFVYLRPVMTKQHHFYSYGTITTTTNWRNGFDNFYAIV